jgi:septal ring factor EnvC (AmiA/AmiB activator)
MKRSTRVWLIILAVVVIIFDVGTYFLLTSKLVKANRELGETKVQLIQEQNEKQLLQGDLVTTKQQLQRVKAELKGTRRELNSVNNKLSGLAKNNLALLEEKEKLEVRLHSLEELKKAIKQVKLEHHRERVQESLIKKQHQKEIDAQKLTQGNCGYLIKNGQSLYPPKVKIEVSPAY